MQSVSFFLQNARLPRLRLDLISLCSLRSRDACLLCSVIKPNSTFGPVSLFFSLTVPSFSRNFGNSKVQSTPKKNRKIPDETRLHILPRTVYLPIAHHSPPVSHDDSDSAINSSSREGVQEPARTQDPRVEGTRPRRLLPEPQLGTRDHNGSAAAGQGSSSFRSPDPAAAATSSDTGRRTIYGTEQQRRG